jgi:hypothetical protein
MANTSQQNGSEQALADYEKDLAGYLQERIKPGLSRSAIPLLARSIAKDIAHREPPEAAPDGEDSQAHEQQGREDSEADEEQPDSEADEEQPDSEADEEQPDAEADEEQPDAEADEEQPDAEADEEEQPDAEADEEPDAEADEEPDAEADEEPDAEADEEQPDFEANMHELQADLGEEWVLHFSVQGDDGWLTAETQDGTQRVEAPDAQRLVTIIDAIDECGGRQP